MSFRAAVKRNLAMTRQAATSTPPEPFGSMPRSAMPVLRVRDVARTASWYGSRLGFSVQSFPAQPPHELAILKRDGVELMVRRSDVDDLASSPAGGWDFYIRVSDGELRSLYDRLKSRERITRELQEMPYGDLEFEVCDADGHTLCLGESIAARNR